MFDKIYDLIVGIGAFLIGIVLVVTQVLSYIGNISAGSKIPFFTSMDTFGFDLMQVIGYNFLGLIGLGFLIKAFFTLKGYIWPLLFGSNAEHHESEN
jgi:ABC-type antimicrobial peptide transport system permease subunit